HDRYPDTHYPLHTSPPTHPLSLHDALPIFPAIHVLFRTSGTKDVDTRDIGAKQSFVASPGHDEPPDGQIKDLLSTPICKNICVPDRKSTRLNSSHRTISYAVFCLIIKQHIV